MAVSRALGSLGSFLPLVSEDDEVSALMESVSELLVDVVLSVVLPLDLFEVYSASFFLGTISRN